MTNSPASDQLNPTRPWVQRVTQALQYASGSLSLCDLDRAQEILESCAEGLPEARTSVERWLLRGFLFEFACRSADHLRCRAVRVAQVRSRGRPSESAVLRSFGDCVTNPVDDFRQWTDAFLRELRRTHQTSAAWRAAWYIRYHYHPGLSVPVLVKHVDVDAARLRREFRREFRMSLRSYQSWVRHLQALHLLLADHKIEAAALLVGYKSKTNFYRVFKRLTNLTPSAFWRLSRSDQARLVAAADRVVEQY